MQLLLSQLHSATLIKSTVPPFAAHNTAFHHENQITPLQQLEYGDLSVNYSHSSSHQIATPSVQSCDATALCQMRN